MESENFIGGRAKLGEQRLELKSKRQKDWRGKDADARMEAGEKRLHL